jgi:hypothetical protein
MRGAPRIRSIRTPNPAQEESMSLTVRPLCLVVLAAVGALLAAAAAPSQAATTIGANLDNPGPLKTLICPSCTAVDRLGANSPVAGVITRWRVRSNTFGQTVTLRVMRVDDQFDGTATGIATGAPQVLSLPLNTFTSRLPIKVGEKLGVNATGDPGIIQDVPAAANVVRFLTPIADGDTEDPGAVVKQNGALAINADVEPDSDGDGFGDESQDGCPTDATKQGACSGGGGGGGGGDPGPIADLVAPRVSVSFKRRFDVGRALRAGRRGALAGKVRSSERGSVLAQADIPGRTARRLGLQRSASRTAIVARSSASLQESATAKLKFRFTRRAKRALRTRRRVGLTLRFTVRDEAGNPTVATKRVVLRR